MRRLAGFFIPLLIGGAASAHDFWLQPRSWQAAPGVAMPFVVEVGHGPFRQQWGADGGHLLALNDLARGGSIDIRALFKAGGEQPHLTRIFQRQGLHIVSLVSTNAASDLPSIRFNDYIKVEGLTPALAQRDRLRLTDTPGRELYSRRVKALVQVGPVGAAQPQVTRAVGLTLEIVPQRNPYTLAPGELLPVEILYQGKPLPGAMVKLNNLDFDARPIEIHLTDVSGRTSFNPPRRGKWQLNVIWTKPITGNPKADFETTFSSLTFGFPNVPAAVPGLPRTG